MSDDTIDAQKIVEKDEHAPDRLTLRKQNLGFSREKLGIFTPPHQKQCDDQCDHPMPSAPFDVVETNGNKTRKTRDFSSKNSSNDTASDTSSKPVFQCLPCNYTSSRKDNFNLHLRTKKHLAHSAADASRHGPLDCETCSQTFSTRAGLWKHRQKCSPDKQVNTLVKYLMTQNSELKTMLVDQQSKFMEQQQQMILEIAKTNHHPGGPLQLTDHSSNHHNQNIVTTNNSHNKTFNLQFFLNETCKNAMNISDFVDSIQLDLSDLERVGEVGYIEGISDIIIKNLKALDVTERPIHCTDKKREIFYVKDANKWEKDDAEKNSIRKVIKKVANKNIRLLPKFKEAHPDCGKSTSRFADQYNRLIIEAIDTDNAEKENKIIRNISRQVDLSGAK